MSNEYYSPSGAPATSAQGSSSVMRAEFTSIQSAFALLPTMSGNGLKVVRVNSGATALEAVAVTGTGSVVMSTSPTLVTPTLGVATATTINKVTLTAPATGSTLTIADGKTLTVNKTITLDGGDSATLSIAASKTFTASNTLTLSGTDGTSLNINAVATLNYGTYTPTLTAIFNCSGLSVQRAFYMRVGNMVLTYVSVTGTYTTTGGATLNVSLPIASALSGTAPLMVTGFSSDTGVQLAWGLTASGTAQLNWNSSQTGSFSATVMFTYIVN